MKTLRDFVAVFKTQGKTHMATFAAIEDPRERSGYFNKHRQEIRFEAENHPLPPTVPTNATPQQIRAAFASIKDPVTRSAFFTAHRDALFQSIYQTKGGKPTL